jgi:predicted RNA-binding Zn-ribbon protein involved in translation (DUF1610 family)
MIDTNVLYQCWENNPDGAGFVFPRRNGELELVKGLMKWKEFKKAWKRLRSDLLGKPVVLHFRVATHGAVNPNNTHPFWVVPEKCAVAHNGILSGTGAVSGTGEKTDTQIFTEEYLAPLYEELPQCFSSKTVRKMLDRACSGSKLAIMQADGGVFLINEKDGLWEEDIWYSNGGYKHRPVVIYGGGMEGFHGQRWRSGGYYDSHDKEWEKAWLWRDDHFEFDADEIEDLAKRNIPEDDLFWCLDCNEFSTGSQVLGLSVEDAKCPNCGDWVYHEDDLFYCPACKEYTLSPDCDRCGFPTTSISELMIKKTTDENGKEVKDAVQITARTSGAAE